MPAIGFPFNFINALSDFWQRFFADSDQLVALYKGSAILMGQAYLDYMSSVLGVALKDAIVFDKEYYKLLTIREDEISFSEGATTDANRWLFTLPDNVVSFASLDNRVVEPTTSLEPNLDYEIADGVVRFHVDPSDPLGTGLPLTGYARRGIDVDVGGKFTDSTVVTWLTSGARKGDTIRQLDVGTNGVQRKRADYVIVLVRADALYVSTETSFPTIPAPPVSSVNYIILRVPPSPTVTAEAFTLVGSAATFAHTRIDQGSVRVFAKAPAGNDVVEGVDYVINYESGSILALTAWSSGTTAAVSYTWREEVIPNAGASPRLATTGIIAASGGTTRVIEIAVWAPDALVDRMTLSNNFGALIGRQEPSSEAYRAFLEGIFQLYVLGPVLERIESALNVVLNLPVVRDDGEVYQTTDISDPLVDRILTLRPATNQTATYEFPKGTPLRTDLVPGQSLLSFEPLTTAVTVTDYVQTPQWWYGQVIPEELFSAINGQSPPIARRTASPVFVKHVYGADDDACFGDPGLYFGASDDGDPSVFGPGHDIFRHRLAFVLMDQYLKYHTFQVTFDATALSATTGSAFAQSLQDLNNLVLSAKPAHTYAFTTPTTFFRDEVQVVDNPISFDRQIGSRVYGPDQVIYTDSTPVFGAGVWNFGDYFTYELWTTSTAFPAIGAPVTLANAPLAPRRRRQVRVQVVATIGGKAVIENIDYSVDYANNTVTRLTAWDVTTVNVVYRQLNIGNLSQGAMPAGYMPVLFNGVDPALITAAYNPTAAGWDGVVEPPTAPRDMSLVERALIVNPH